MWFDGSNSVDHQNNLEFIETVKPLLWVKLQKWYLFLLVLQKNIYPDFVVQMQFTLYIHSTITAKNGKFYIEFE